MHLGDAVGILGKRTEDGAGMCSGRGDGEVSAIVRGSAQTGGLNLVADRAGDTVGRRRIVGMIGPERQPLEDLGRKALLLVLERLQGHVAACALSLDRGARLGMVECLAAHAALPVRIARRISHDAGAPLHSNRDVLALCGLKVVVAGDAAA